MRAIDYLTRSEVLKAIATREINVECSRTNRSFDKITIHENSFEIFVKIITPLLIGGTHVHEIVLKPFIHKG